MANAGGSWDNAKKVVEVDLKDKGTELHAATVIGDTVGDPFKDTSSVSLNPIIKFSTLFGLLATEIAIEMAVHAKETGSHELCAVFFNSTVYHRSCVRMAFVLQYENTGGINRTPCTVAYKKALAPKRGEGFLFSSLHLFGCRRLLISRKQPAIIERALKIFLKFLFSVAP